MKIANKVERLMMNFKVTNWTIKHEIMYLRSHLSVSRSYTFWALGRPGRLAIVLEVSGQSTLAPLHRFYILHHCTELIYKGLYYARMSCMWS